MSTKVSKAQHSLLQNLLLFASFVFWGVGVGIGYLRLALNLVLAADDLELLIL